jgi:hypothetical protein
MKEAGRRLLQRAGDAQVADTGKAPIHNLIVELKDAVK